MNRESYFSNKIKLNDSTFYSLNNILEIKNKMPCQCSSCLSSKYSERNNELKDHQERSQTSTSFQKMANYLVDGYWADTSSSNREWNLSSKGSNPQSGTITFSLGNNRYDSDGITIEVAELYRDSFKLFEETLGINFEEYSSFTTSADIEIIDNYDGAFAGSDYSNSKISWSYINISESWTDYYGSNMGTYSLQTIHHEIGHALGLGHQGNYNGSANYGFDEIFQNDSWQASMMSYFSQSENFNIDADSVYLMTPSAVDWIALDDIYSAYSGYGVENAFTGDTIFGFNTNISSTTSRIWNSFSSMIRTNAYCLVDGSGNDTLDLSGLISNNNVDLRPTDKTNNLLYTSDIGGLKGNLHIAAETYIENCITGSGNDQIIGNIQNNNLLSGSGNDILYGGSGGDKLAGDNGEDNLYGQDGEDNLFGGIDNDNLYGGDNNDFLAGEAGNDHIEGGEGVDQLYGGDGNDTLFGGLGDDRLAGEAGNDHMEGEQGVDQLYGGDGNDALLGNAGNDRLAGEGSGDSLHGGDGEDTLFGGLGDDILYGDTDDDSLTGGSGADSLFGGSGADTFFFSSTDDSGIESSARDIITDFSSSESDKIDLSAIDANINLEGDQEFTYVGSASFTNLGHQARFSDGILYLTTDGDADAEMAIELTNVSSLSSSDFVL